MLAKLSIVSTKTNNQLSHSLKQDASERLPKIWRSTLSSADQLWIGRELFDPDGKIVSNVKLWYNPPSYKHTGLSPPQVIYLFSS